MRRTLRLLVLTLATLAVSASFTHADPGALALKAGSKLWLTGSSTLHEFSSHASRLEVTFQHDPARWPAAATRGDAVENLIRAKGVTSMDVVVGVTGLHSGKDGLDRNMYKTLAADKHPDIRFRMTSYEVAGAGSAPAMTIDTKGTLTIAGVERNILMSVSANREGDLVRLRGSVPVLMSQFGIKPPTMMMGAVRTADQVVVHFDLVIGAKDAAGAMSGSE